MELTVREAAAFLGRSPRTVRAQLLEGKLPGRKVNGRWRLDKGDLPLDRRQRRRLQRRAGALRDAVEAVLPSRFARGERERRKVLGDLEVFREVHGLLISLEGLERNPGVSLGTEWRDVVRRVTMHLGRSLDQLSVAVAHFDAPTKLEAANRARTGLALALAHLYRASPELPPEEPLLGLILRIEDGVLPMVSGFARWVERLPQHPGRWNSRQGDPRGLS